MKQLVIKVWFVSMVMGASFLQAAICPDPHTSSLAQGIVPPPWFLNPFSEHGPGVEANTQFVRANILVAGYGRGILCTYLNSVGYYSIWWLVHVKIPAPTDNYWRNTLGGFECTTSLETCVFYPA